MEKQKSNISIEFFTAYQSDMKKTCRTINETLNRNKNNGDLPTTIFHDVQLSDAKEIATTFNTYFANIGKKLAANNNDNTFDDLQQYLDTR